jgi:Probable zinc-ribbon domain
MFMDHQLQPGAEEDAIEALQRAAEAVEQHFPPGRDKVDCLRRIGLRISALSVHGEVRMCARCKCQFTFTAGERRFYAEKHFDPPTHCASCRSLRRSERKFCGQASYGLREEGSHNV